MKTDCRAVSRRHFLRVGGAAALAAGSTLSFSIAAPARRRPNILLILTDQQHLDTIAHAGCRHIRTPAMDELARRGVRFTQSCSANPLCSPARATLLTGRTSCETGVFNNGRPIRAEIPNLGQWLTEMAGYQAAYAGKWHLPATHTLSMPGFTVLTTGIGGQGNLGDTATSRACEAFLRGRSGAEPFLLVASFLQPHDICEWLRLNSRRMERLPIVGIEDHLPPLPANFAYDAQEPAAVQAVRHGNEGTSNHWDEWQWRYYQWSYYRHVEMVDAEIGRVLRALDESGQADNTVIVFTSDHGEGIGSHQMTRKNFLYGESLNVPLIVSWPGSVPADAVDREHVVSGLDIMPTLCACAGVAAPPRQRGHNLLPLFAGNQLQWREFCVSEVAANRGRMVRTRDFKYIVYRDDPVVQLFNLRDDPGELRNLAGNGAFTDVLQAHRALLSDWERHLDLPAGVPSPEAFI